MIRLFYHKNHEGWIAENTITGSKTSIDSNVVKSYFNSGFIIDNIDHNSEYIIYDLRRPSKITADGIIAEICSDSSIEEIIVEKNSVTLMGQPRVSSYNMEPTEIREFLALTVFDDGVVGSENFDFIPFDKGFKLRRIIKEVER